MTTTHAKDIARHAVHHDTGWHIRIADVSAIETKPNAGVILVRLAGGMRHAVTYPTWQAAAEKLRAPRTTNDRARCTCGRDH